jgi:hypothetical protein
MFDKVCIEGDNGSLIIPIDKVERWKEQLKTPYAELSMAEQESDQHQVELIHAALDRTDHMDKLANLQHDFWSNWMEYLFGSAEKNENGTYTIPVEIVTRWKHLASLEHRFISVVDQHLCLHEADKIIEVLSGN